MEESVDATVTAAGWKGAKNRAYLLLAFFAPRTKIATVRLSVRLPLLSSQCSQGQFQDWMRTTDMNPLFKAPGHQYYLIGNLGVGSSHGKRFTDSVWCCLHHVSSTVTSKLIKCHVSVGHCLQQSVSVDSSAINSRAERGHRLLYFSP